MSEPLGLLTLVCSECEQTFQVYRPNREDIEDPVCRHCLRFAGECKRDNELARKFARSLFEPFLKGKVT